MSVGSTREEFPFFEKLGFASIGPCRTMEPDENLMRLQATNALLEIYSFLNSKGRLPRLTLCGKMVEQEEFLLPSEWQQTTSQKDGIKLHLVMPCLGVPFSQCIGSIRTCSELVIDCTNAAEIVSMSVMNIFFSDIRIAHIQKYLRSKMKADAPLSALRSLMRSYIYAENISTKEINNIELGDFFYIPGHPNYSDESHLNYARGENVFCVGFKAGHPMFMGFSSCFISDPKTIEEIQKYLAHGYLKQPEGSDTVTVAFEQILQKIKQQSFFLGKLDIQSIIRRTVLSM